jgi:hypothetical protein
MLRAVQVLQDVVAEWFSLVDADHSGRLTQDELARTFAVRACGHRYL